MEISSQLLAEYLLEKYRFNVSIELSVHHYKCWLVASIERIFEAREEASSEFTLLG